MRADATTVHPDYFPHLGHGALVIRLITQPFSSLSTVSDRDPSQPGVGQGMCSTHTVLGMVSLLDHS